MNQDHIPIGPNNNEREPRPQASTDLVEIRLRLRSSAECYKAAGKHQFKYLKNVCQWTNMLKGTFMALPRENRPVATWVEYASDVLKWCGLGCGSERMADYYVALHKDMAKVGIDEIAKRVSDGSYREARRVTDVLLNKKTLETVSTEGADFSRAARLIRKVTERTGIQNFAELPEQLENAAKAYDTRDTNVIPELATLGLPDGVRHRINFAVRMANHSSAAAGLRAFDVASFHGVEGTSQMVFEEWAFEVPADCGPGSTLPGTALKPWLEKRKNLSAALDKHFATENIVIKSGGEPGVCHWQLTTRRAS